MNLSLLLGCLLDVRVSGYNRVKKRQRDYIECISSSSENYSPKVWSLNAVAAMLSTPAGGETRAGAGGGGAGCCYAAHTLIPFQQDQQQPALHSTTLGAL